MEEKSTYTLILNGKSFSIPSNFHLINDVNPDIFQTLKNKKQYKVQSNISEEVLTSFISNWVKNEPFNITHDNFSEYEQLSNEFDRMKEIITLFKNRALITTEYSLKYEKRKLEKEKSAKNDELKKKLIKYQEIIHILFDNNNPEHYLHLFENMHELFFACLDENSELISLLTHKIIKNPRFSFSLNEENKTATIIQLLTKRNQVFIPRSITYESTEFIVTRISENSFKEKSDVLSVTFSYNPEIRFIDKKSFSRCFLTKISIPPHVEILNDSVFHRCHFLKNVTFSQNSELKIISKNAFSESGIESLTIPSKVEKLENGWCEKVDRLKNINIMKENKCFTWYNDQFILGKSDPKSDKFDVLLFARRDIQVANIPSFIKRIGPCAFENCKQIIKLNFLPNSELEKIEFNAFKCSSIQKICIPSHVKKISKSAFELCKNLSHVTFESNSELKSIGKFAFAHSAIEDFTIPDKVEEIKYGCFCGTESLNSIKIDVKNKFIQYYKNQFLLTKSDPKSDNFDILLFANRNIEEVIIPSFIKHINAFAFERCSHINHFDFAPDSEIQIIDDHALSSTSVKEFVIPKYVTRIGVKSFAYSKAENIKFAANSRLKTIDNDAFLLSKIESISIPSCVANFVNEWCGCTSGFTSITVYPSGKQNILWYENDLLLKKSDEKSDIFDILLFARRDIIKVTIPSFIKQISNSAFSECLNAEKIDFHPESKLEFIDKFAFVNCRIESLIIPKHLKKIEIGTFCGCHKLKKIIISEDSELEEIGGETFSFSSINCFFIPKHVKEIKFGAFCNCNNLQIIEISSHSKLKVIGIDVIGSKLLFIPSELKDCLYIKK